MKEKKSDWAKMKSAEIEKLVIDLHRNGYSPPKIGLVLRDKHNIPKAKFLGKKITKILKDSDEKYLTEKDIYMKKIESIEKHVLGHKHDYTAKRALTKSLWAIKKLN